MSSLSGRVTLGRRTAGKLDEALLAEDLQAKAAGTLSRQADDVPGGSEAAGDITCGTGAVAQRPQVRRERAEPQDFRGVLAVVRMAIATSPAGTLASQASPASQTSPLAQAVDQSS